MEQAAVFPETHWSLVLAARPEAVDRKAALEELCRAYWPPLYAYCRRDGQSPEAAQDLVQGFLARLLARDDLATVAPERGRFRSYLLAGLRHHLASEARREAAAKRGGGGDILSLNVAEIEAALAPALADRVTPEVLFDRRWARTVMDRALTALATEYAVRDQAELFGRLKPALVDGDGGGHAELGRALGLSEGAVAVALHRLRRRYRELVRHEVAQTAGSAADLEDELRHLRAVWSV